MTMLDKVAVLDKVKRRGKKKLLQSDAIKV